MDNIRTDRQKKDKLKKVEISLSDYECMLPEDRAYYLVDALEREISAPLRHGVNRFESLLQIFNLDGEIDENTAKTLFELNAVRNVIVHRSGIADRRFSELCPWFETSFGSKITTNKVLFDKYGSACGEYVTILISRLCKFYGVSINK